MLKSLPIILMVVFICSQSFAMLPQEMLRGKVR